MSIVIIDLKKLLSFRMNSVTDKRQQTNKITTTNTKKLNKRNTLNEITRFGVKFQLPLAPPHAIYCTCFHIPYLLL